MKSFEDLKQFRQRAYELLGRAKDATFELMDAVMLTKEVSSYPELSSSPVFRRGWSSIYEAIKDNPRPWQKSQTPRSMTPGRVAQSMGGVLAVIATPAVVPKPRGKSPGWQ